LQGHDAELFRPSFRRLQDAIRLWKRTGPIRRHGSYFDTQADAALARIACTRSSMYLAAARTIAANFPELFGKQKSEGALQQAINKALVARDEALAALETGWTPADIDASSTQVVFVLLPTVQLGGDRVGERLANAWAEARAARKAA
jgi:hypothetical protein